MNPYTSRRDWLRGAAVGGVALAGLRDTARVHGTTPKPAHRSTGPASGYRQLFLDDVMIERIAGLRRVVNPPTKHAGNPIIRHDQTPWQTFRAQVYGTAMYDADAKRFKIWYLAGVRLPFDEPVRINGRLCCPNFQCVGYATSRDGLKFELPDLGLVDFNGSTRNNLCRIARECAEGIAVLRDPHDPNPRRRYKALYWEHFVPYRDSPGVNVNGMSVSFSADGTTWTNCESNPVIAQGSDTGQQILWDPHLNKYVVYGRFGAGGRRVARSESADFVNWSASKLVFQADAADGPGTQIYGMGIGLYEGVYLGLPWIFREGTTHKIDVQLATSRDGVQWTRVADRHTFIPNGPAGRWDAGILFTACPGPVVVGDTIYIYYSASRHDHDYRQRPAEGSPTWDDYWDSVKTSIGVATLRRDGFVSLDAGDQPGEVVTRSFTWPARGSLHINADARVLDASQRPLPGFERSDIVTGDHLDRAVTWPAAQRDSLAGRTVRLQFLLRRAKCYSYWLT